MYYFIDDILIYDLWSLKYIARIKISESSADLKAENNLTIVY